ncbi:MAG TPA: DNA polymerase III subunit beta [Phycisphaerae bacterium]|nr:DNA polymerase III subunit beta [Phycisphaerae bacterium]HOJ72656.1 DNA polymerase III subunit beta [Phycisphaerae bacterium]HOM49683.1 DNA polymerase III subunit beta [Phycisphaerae bacterium]HON65180.1 DNA polymerase III subunit beta [Phycisphaerae bacterium]HOQ85119.1 DNA polymerase III subunit beta [Phycisphaerae bacterium]
MHVIISRSALLEVLGAASSVAATRTTKEVLKCVRLTTKDDTLVLGATDLEVALRVEIRQVQIKKKGDLLIPADKLTQIARECTDDTLTLESDEQVCHIRGQDSHFEIYGHDPREFPPVPELEGQPDAEIEAATLLELINKTLFAVAKENTRYAINGILWQKAGKKLVLVSTDGRRLARAQGPAEGTGGGDTQMIVPAKTVQVLQRVLGHAEGKAAVRFAGNQVVVRADSYVVSSALVEGHFPQYEEVIPKDNDKKVELDTEEFLSAVRRAALLTNEQSKGVRLKFDDNQLILSSRAPEQGEATISMKIEYTAAPVEIGFNPLFLTEALRVANAPTITLEMKDGNRPGVFRAGPSFLYVVMPVNLA